MRIALATQNTRSSAATTAALVARGAGHSAA